MSGQHTITTISELVEVATLDNIDTLTADLTTWLRMHVRLKPSAVEMSRIFLWRDDEKPGISEVRLKLKPEGDSE